VLDIYSESWTVPVLIFNAYLSPTTYASLFKEAIVGTHGFMPAQASALSVIVSYNLSPVWLTSALLSFVFTGFFCLCRAAASQYVGTWLGNQRVAGLSPRTDQEWS